VRNFNGGIQRELAAIRVPGSSGHIAADATAVAIVAGVDVSTAEAEETAGAEDLTVAVAETEGRTAGITAGTVMRHSDGHS